MTDCAWCGQPFAANTFGRPKVYCSVRCRTDAAHYREDLPAWQAELVRLERDAAGYRPRPVPVFLRNRIDELRRLIWADGRGQGHPPRVDVVR